MQPKLQASREGLALNTGAPAASSFETPTPLQAQAYHATSGGAWAAMGKYGRAREEAEEAAVAVSAEEEEEENNDVPLLLLLLSLLEEEGEEEEEAAAMAEAMAQGGSATVSPMLAEHSRSRTIRHRPP